MSPEQRDKTSVPIIPVNTRIDPATGRLQVATVNFVPGMILKRCGKLYQVDKYGTQRRIENVK